MALSKLSQKTSSPLSRLSQLSSQLSTRFASSTTTSTSSPTQHRLNTGASIPAIGFGTWQDADAQEAAVATALRAGYRHIDTAHIYGTETAVGKALRASGVPREEVFVTTKLWNNAHEPQDVEKQLDKSLAALGLEWVDLWLMHWPSPFKAGEKLIPKGEDGKTAAGTADYIDTYKAMERCFQKGKAKAIGVSNFSLAEMERLVANVEVIPAAHQYECHPWLQQAAFHAWHESRGIHVQQYSPFGNANEIYDKGKKLGKLIQDETLTEIGKKYGKSGAQVALAWGIAHGRSVLPKSKTDSRIEANLQGDFRLEAEDVKRIDAMDKKLRFNDPSKPFKWNFYADLDGKE